MIDQLNLQVDTIALAASMTNRVRHKLARHEQSVLHVLLVDPATTERASKMPPRLADRLRLGRKR